MNAWKQTGPLLCALLLLAGCGRTEPLSPSAEASAAILEAPWLQGVSMAAAPVAGQPFTPEEPLPEGLTSMMEGDAMEQGIWRAAETADGRAALYALAAESGRVLIQWGDALAAFDGWEFQTPRGIAPWLACLDVDGDGEEELVADLCCGSGTGYSVEALHVVEREADGGLTDYPLPAALYEVRLLELVEVEADGTSGTVSLGPVCLDLPDPPESPYTGEVWLGDIVGFSATLDGALWARFAVGLRSEAWASLCFCGRIFARVSFSGGVYRLSDFALGAE